jgi:hypothetical protein
MPGIFISYRRDDTSGHAGRLRSKLARRYGRSRVFMDIDSIPSGTPFRERIQDALNSCDVAIVLVGDRWAAPLPPGEDDSAPRARIDKDGDFVRLEVAAALTRDDVSVVPVMVEGAGLPTLPDDLAELPNLQTRELRNTEWRADTARIFDAIDEKDTRLRRSRRRLWELGRKPLVAGCLLALVAAAIALAFGPSSPRAVACANADLEPPVREKLSRAEGTRDPAIHKSVYYGVCGQRAWAVAEFPNGNRDVFAQDGFHWAKLGPAASTECSRVPGDLLTAWGESC